MPPRLLSSSCTNISESLGAAYLTSNVVGNGQIKQINTWRLELFSSLNPLSMVVLTAESKARSRKIKSFNLAWGLRRTGWSSTRASTNFWKKKRKKKEICIIIEILFEVSYSLPNSNLVKPPSVDRCSYLQHVLVWS